MIVYKINFPCGHYYIGKTKYTLLYRLRQHLNNPINKKKIKVIYDYNYNTIDLLKISSILYTGWDAGFVERSIIYESKNDKYCLNGSFPPQKPEYTYWLENYYNKEQK